jgi:colanic acid/amylovoran biosynthesis glycosyltransferase
MSPPASQVHSIAYLQSQYPMLSMIFVVREVQQLRSMGLRVEVASINSPDRKLDALTQVERDEAERTYYVKAHGARGALAAHAWAALRCTRGYLRGWVNALRLAKADGARLARNIAYLSEALMVLRWMRREGHGHLHAHLGSQPATVGMFARLVGGCGLSITVHGPDEFYDVPGQYLPQKVEHADFIVCISDFARSQLMKLSPYEHWCKLEVCRLGVDPTVFSPRPTPGLRGPFEILCVGRLTPAKGQHVLLDAVAQLARRGHAVRLRLVGAGVDAAALERHAEQLQLGASVIFEGAVDQDGIRECYRAAHCFCLPSFAEGIPVVLMEAMAMCIPCVTTRITGIPELICDGVSGLLVAPSDVVGLAAAIERLIADPELGAALGRGGREAVIEGYDLERNVKRLAEVFGARLRGRDDHASRPWWRRSCFDSGRC